MNGCSNWVDVGYISTGLMYAVLSPFFWAWIFLSIQWWCIVVLRHVMHSDSNLLALFLLLTYKQCHQVPSKSWAWIHLSDDKISIGEIFLHSDQPRTQRAKVDSVPIRVLHSLWRHQSLRIRYSHCYIERLGQLLCIKMCHFKLPFLLALAV